MFKFVRIYNIHLMRYLAVLSVTAISAHAQKQPFISFRWKSDNVAGFGVFSVY